MKNVKQFNEFLFEGTWALETGKMNAMIGEIKNLKSPSDINDAFYKKWWNSVGDDELYDFLDAAKAGESFSKNIGLAIKRIEELKQAKT